MKIGDKVIAYGYIDGYSYETTGQTNYIIALETGERVEIPLGGAINVDEIVFKDNIKLKDVIKRIKGFDDETKFKWTYDILKELGSDFGSKIFHEAYQQGRFDEGIEAHHGREKVKVPQFVADWYEERKNNIDFEIWHYLHTFSSQKEDEFKKWMNKVGLKQIQTLVNMHQFGYEVEKEPKYTVRVKGINGYGQYLNKASSSKTYCFASEIEKYGYKTKHTRKELEEAGFGWVFDCEGVEVEEVTE